MKECRETTQIVRECVAIRCDRCGRKSTWDEDVFEAQEFHHIRFRGGFASVFGDETLCECEICQHCLKEFIGTFVRYPESGVKE